MRTDFKVKKRGDHRHRCPEGLSKEAVQHPASLIGERYSKRGLQLSLRTFRFRTVGLIS